MKYVTVTLKETKTRRVNINDLPKLVAQGCQIISIDGQNGKAIRIGKPPQFKTQAKAKTNGATKINGASQKARVAHWAARTKGKKVGALLPGSIGEGLFKMFQAAPNKRFTTGQIQTKLKALNSKSNASTMVNNIGMTLKNAILRDVATGTYRLNPDFKG